MLEVQSLTRAFAGLVAVDEVSFTVEAGTVHALIGPNGAGKTTLFNMLSGLIAPSRGRILFRNKDFTRLPAHRRAALGMARTFQNLRVFGGMTALENVLAGMHPRLDAPWIEAVMRFPRGRAEERHAKERAHALLARVGIGAFADRPASDLAYGDQRRLEIARALAGEPALLLLDEPAAGMNPAETAALADIVRSLKGDCLTILVVEHDMGFVMRLSDRVTVLNFGRKIAEGRPGEIRGDQAVIEAYLGLRAARRLDGEAG